MMTALVNSIDVGLNMYQMTQSMQPKVNEKTAAEELKAEEQQQAESVSTQKISTGKSALAMFHIKNAAEVGLLRPVWLEAMEIMNMDRDMPIMRDLLKRSLEKKNSNYETVADEAERADEYEQAAGGTKQADVKAEQSVDGIKQADVKFEQSVDGTKQVDVETGQVADGTQQAVTSPE